MKNAAAWLLFDPTAPTAFSFDLPEISLYHRVTTETRSHTAAGYILGLDRQTSAEILIEEVVSGKHRHLISTHEKFVLFVFSKEKQTLTVVTDVVSTFPVYWARQGRGVVFTLNIPWLIDKFDTLTVNTNTLLQFVGRDMGFQNETLFTEISRVPQACTLTVSAGSDPELDSYLTGEITREIVPYSGAEELMEAFTKAMDVVFSDYARVLEGKDVVCDLSAGLDSTAVAYWLKRVSGKQIPCFTHDQPEPYNSQNADIIGEFAQKHGLPLSVTTETPESIASFLSLDMEYPIPRNGYATVQHLRLLRHFSSDVNIGGYGGDELFWPKSIHERFLLKPYLSYFDLVDTLENGFATLLTPLGERHILDQKRHGNSLHYPSLITESYIATLTRIFQYSWEEGIALLAPLGDKRLVEVFQRAPLSVRKWKKREFWSHMNPVIHTPEQLSAENIQRYEKSIHRLIQEDRESIVDTLERSAIAGTGLFPIDRIMQSFSRGSLSEYTAENDVSVHLLFLLKVDHYLQQLGRVKKLKFDSERGE